MGLHFEDLGRADALDRGGLTAILFAMTDTRTLEAGCLCGAVRYRIAGPLGKQTHCHCNLCRRASGAPVVTWVTVAPGDFTLTRGILRKYRSTPQGQRGFCAACGSQITFDALNLPDEVDVTAATLDDPEAVHPKKHIWTGSRTNWLIMNDGLPEREAY